MTDNFSLALRELHQRDVTVTDDETGLEIVTSLHDLYTVRACDVLALALVDMIESSEIIEIRTAGDWSGFLLHAGVHRDDHVYDIEGVHEVDEWVERWGRGMQIEVRFFRPDEALQTSKDEKCNKLARWVAERLMDVPEFASARLSLLQL